MSYLRNAGGIAAKSRVFTAGVMVVAALFHSPDVGAQAAPAAAGAPAADLDSARRQYAQGEDRFKAGDFAGALTAFQSAEAIKPTAQAERYIGLCEDRLAHYAAAVDGYDKFLAHVPENLAAEAAEARGREAAIKAMPGKVHIVSDPVGADVTVDDKPQPMRAPLDVDLPAGTHKVTFSAPDRVGVEKIVDVAFASNQTVTAELGPQPPPPAVAVKVPVQPPPASNVPQEPPSRLPAFITGGLAIAAAGVGTVFGVLALNDKSSFNRTPTTQTADNGETHSLIADMAFGVAITFGVTSAVLLLTRDEPVTTSSSTLKDQKQALARRRVATNQRAIVVTPTPLVGLHYGGAGISVTF
ncbi:MAG: PEGA domain-containing protein [Polyangiaceae bacterium]